MKNQTSVLLAVMLFLPACVFARIGETPAQCETRYGKAFKTDTDSGMSFFRKGGFLIMVGFHQGKAGLVSYRKEETDILDNAKEMSDNEIETLLKANGGNKKWKKREIISMDKEWQTEDGTLFAQYMTMQNYLTVVTKEYIEREDAKKKAKEKKDLEGL